MKRPQGFDRSQPTPTPKPPAPKSKPKVAPASGAVTELNDRRRLRVGEELPSPRAAKRERTRYEREEVRRFTRRTRARRRIVVGAVVVTAALFSTVAVAVFSPAMALESIDVRGTHRLDAAQVSAAVADQLGTPLALVDVTKIEAALRAFPLVQSYSTQAVPPHTLVVTVVERTPVGVVADGSTFAVIDPAGIVVDSVATRPADLPLIDAGEASLGNRAFVSAVEVITALPASLRSRVDVITATTKDDVQFTLSGGSQSVRWGSADRSAYKARVFAALVAAQKQSANIEYDVSSPDAAVVRQR